MIGLSIAMGSSHGIMAVGQRLWAWGNNQSGQLGLTNLTPHLVFTPVTTLPLLPDEQLVQLSAGNWHSVVLTSLGRLLTSGHNNCGQLGLGDTPSRSVFTPVMDLPLLPDERLVQLAAGGWHTIVLTSMGRLLACGHNACGQLGLGNTVNSSRFTPVTNLPLEADEQLVQLAVGTMHTVALTSMGRLLICGYNDEGQLGLGDTPSCSVFTPVNTLPLLADERLVQLVAGNWYTVTLTSLGRLLACGSNRYGQQGLGDTLSRSVFTPVTNLPLEANERLIQLAMGEGHAIALTSMSRLLACGDNDYGQLGLGKIVQRSVFTPVLDLPLGANERLVQIAAGGGHNIIITSLGRLLTSGHNGYGELGLGDTLTRSVFTPLSLRLAHPTWGISPRAASAEAAVQKAPFCQLPVELLRRIFDCLTMKEVCQLLQVCRDFSKVISTEYRQPALVLQPTIMSPAPVIQFTLADIVARAREIYRALSPAQQVAFRREFIACVPAQLAQHTLLQLLPSAPLFACPSCRIDYDDDHHRAMRLRPCEHRVCISCFPRLADAFPTNCPVCHDSFSGIECV